MRRPARKSSLSDAQTVDPNHSRSYAIFLLSRRDYSASELRKKMKGRGYVEDAIIPVVDDLLASNTINDQRYGSNVVAYRARRGQGPVRIRNELRRAGVAAEDVEAAVIGAAEGDSPDFVKRAREVRARKFGPEIPRDRKERAKQARFLQYRGFSNDHIRAALEGDLEDGEPDLS
ncbi:MAG: regulatory protein RecX [Steroidobacteraceae bacterium]|nr:regulatory protein RecX [Steroidobacteraceae bacterium]